MKENKYDTLSFFEKYSEMSRSTQGLKAAGEWQTLKDQFPDLSGHQVLDLGCGFGWHCRYVIEQGAASVLGVDISKRMINKAREINQMPGITYKMMAIEELILEPQRFDFIFSSLTFHYLADFKDICSSVFQWLKPGAVFLFSVEHPIFTAEGRQDWSFDEKGKKIYWPVDNYFMQGQRQTLFLGEKIIKYHRTLTNYVSTLIQTGFQVLSLIEPTPSDKILEEFPELQEELRRPMMLIIKASKS